MSSIAFTLQSEHRLLRIISPCSVSVPVPPGSKEAQTTPHPIHDTQALWDTGATNSVITAALAKRLNLKPIGKTRVTHGGGVSLENVYFINIHLRAPGAGLNIVNVRVTECVDTDGSWGMIIGMDIITLGDFSISNVDSKTCMSFRYPSAHRLDFTDGARRALPQPTNHLLGASRKIHRNAVVTVKNPKTGQKKIAKYKQIEHLLAQGWQVE